MLSCLRAEDYNEARKRRWFGIDRAQSELSLLGERQYDITEVGYKYHMNNIAAAIGLGNLSDFHQRLKRRQQIGNRYQRELRGVPGLELLDIGDDRTHAYWLFTMLVEGRIDFINKLGEYAIPASVVHQRIDRYSVFGGVREELENQAVFDQRQISIPVHEALTDEEVDKIIRVIRSGW